MIRWQVQACGSWSEEPLICGLADSLDAAIAWAIAEIEALIEARYDGRVAVSVVEVRS